MKKFALLLVLLSLVPCAWGGPLQEKNKAVARRVFEEIFNQGKFQVAEGIYAPDFVNHGVKSDVGLPEDQAAARGWKEAFRSTS